MKIIQRIFISVLFVSGFCNLNAEDGYRLWLRYDKLSDIKMLSQYNKSITGWLIEGKSPTLSVSGRELNDGLGGLLGVQVPSVTSVKRDGIIIAGTPENSDVIASLNLDDRLKEINDEGYLILTTTYKKKKITE